MATIRRSIVDEWMQPDNLMLLECWSRDGANYSDIAARIGIAPPTLTAWRDKYPEIGEALRKGREIVDYKVENALLKAALGYDIEETKTIMGKADKEGNRSVRVERVSKTIPPNVTAIAIWLNNRKPDQWKRNRDNVLELSENDSNITVNIIKHDKDKKKETTKVSCTDESKNKEKANTLKTETKPEEDWDKEWEETPDTEKEWD